MTSSICSMLRDRLKPSDPLIRFLHVMLVHKSSPMLSSRLHAPKLSGAFARQGGARATAFVIRCCALPNEKPKKKASVPTSQVFNITGGEGGVHIHIGDATGQTAEWAAVAMSPEAKALLQKHAVKASTALKMHNILGFEDVGDLQRLSPDLIAQLELKPLQLEPLLHMLRDHQQQQQDTPLILGMQLDRQDGGEQPDAQQQHAGQAQVAGHADADATPAPGALPAALSAVAGHPGWRGGLLASFQQASSQIQASFQQASSQIPFNFLPPSKQRASPLPAVSPAADDFPAAADQTADQQEDAGKAVPTPAARGGARAEPGTGGSTQPGWGLFGGALFGRALNVQVDRHACVAVMQEKAGTVNGVAITPDSRRAVTAGPGSEAHVWDLEACSCIATLGGHNDDVLAVAITPDGRRAVSISWRELSVWDLDTYACTASLDAGYAGGNGPALAITPDGRHALYGHGRKLCKWALDGYDAWELDRCAQGIQSIAVTPDGRLAVTGGSYDKLHVWDLRSELQVGTLGQHNQQTSSLAITPDGRYAVSGGAHKPSLLMWDLATRACIGTMEGHEERVSCVAISPDGRRAVSGSEDRKLRVWDLATRTCTGIMEPSTWVECVAITPDGRYAVSGGKDLRVWDLGPGSAGSKAGSRLTLLAALAAAAAAAAVVWHR